MTTTFYNKTIQSELPLVSPYQISQRQTGRPVFGGRNEHEVVAKLQYAFSIGGSVKEACLFSGISTDSFYRYCKKNPEFRDIYQGLQIMPILQAKMTVVRALIEGNVKIAWKYLETHSPEEFSHNPAVQKQLQEKTERIEYLEEILRDRDIPFDYF